MILESVGSWWTSQGQLGPEEQEALCGQGLHGGRGRAVGAASAAQRFGTWDVESDSPVLQSWLCPTTRDLQHAAVPR